MQIEILLEMQQEIITMHGKSKVLENQRKWSTLIHPADIDQTN